MHLFCRSRRFSSSFTCRGAEAFSHGPDGSSDHRDSQLLLNTVIDVPFVQVLQASPGRSHPCRGAEAVSHGLADHGDSPVARGPVLQVVRVPQVPSW